jgi:phosphate transport system substrate-binding protein
MNRLLIVVLSLLLLAGCKSRDKKGKIVDTPTSGELTIAVDEALKPLIETEIATFNSLYTSAHVRAIYVSEKQAIDTLLKDSVRMIIVTRQLYAEEEQVIKSKQFPLRQIKAAIGGVALVVHPENQDTSMTLDQVTAILKGEIKTWKQLNNESKDKLINVVFDQPQSGIIRYLNDSLFTFSSLPENCFALDSNAAVIDYVSKNPTALGLVDLSWLSDRDDATTNKFLKSIRVVGLSTTGEEYYQPFPAYISLGQYPFSRDVMLISQEARSGLATGFISFITHEKGQRIILKSGLVPATSPVRIVEVNRNPM